MKNALITLLTATALALAACGEDETGEQGAESSTTPEAALAELTVVRAALGDAASTYAKGDAKAAAEAVNQAYLESFELVEGPLEEADPELNEELEGQIREELVDKIEAGDPPPEVAALVAEINRGLDEARLALRGETPAEGGEGN